MHTLAENMLKVSHKLKDRKIRAKQNSFTYLCCILLLWHKDYCKVHKERSAMM